ncbi:hypothetical protein NQ318_010813 [Aromia moschata]|uniref:DUF4817 domain-containing protein n=1 Tax=Aromia moschata TaxID=1265417 RepID=A0AAV8YHN3_9CUCU|nr:hypothetical protein NQ318_010813 [Aromia moschata]
MLVKLEALQSINLDGCVDKTRTQQQVCEIFNTKYPDRRISQSTVSRIENKFREFGNVTDIPKSGRKHILDDEQKLDILLDIQDNPHQPTRQVAADNDFGYIPNCITLLYVKYNWCLREHNRLFNEKGTRQRR